MKKSKKIYKKYMTNRLLLHNMMPKEPPAIYASGEIYNYFIKINMVLETTECIPINNGSITYTDCMEFSLLRFLQLLLYDPRQIGKDGFSFYPNMEGLIKTHIKKYGKIYEIAEYYLSDGKIEREEWANFLSNKEFMKYYRNDNCELFTCLTNIFNFFNIFLGLKFKNIEEIGKKFSNKNKNISICIKETKTYKKEMKMKEIIDLLSRPEDEYEINKKYFVKDSKTIISISIDNMHFYEWILTEIVIDGYCEYSNRYITGHSVIIKV